MTTQSAIVQMQVGEINPAPYNPRNISDEALEGLKNSIQKFGMPQPLVVNSKTGVLVAGHQRLKAAQMLGWTEVPVVMVNLTPAEERALNVTLNNPRIAGHFTENLQVLLEGLQMDLGDDYLKDLRLDDLIIPDNWNKGTEDVNDTAEHLDGITATIKVRCPQEIRDEVLIYLKAKFLEVSFAGVQVV